MEPVTEGKKKKEGKVTETSKESSLYNGLLTGFHQRLTVYSSHEANTSLVNSWFQDIIHAALTRALALNKAGSFKSLWIESWVFMFLSLVTKHSDTFLTVKPLANH